MIIDSFYEDFDAKSWSTEPDFDCYGDELAFYTEGTILFEGEDSDFYINIYLLEFIVEVDIMLRRRLGQRFFEECLSLQLSGESLSFSRSESELFVSMARQNKIVAYDWARFIELFLSVKMQFKKKLNEHYPNISKFIEFKLVLD
ncbi:MAG: hypothetical protein Sw2PiMacB_11790 [Shewanella algae]